MKHILAAAFTVSCTLLVSSCRTAESPRSSYVLGTICTVNAYSDGTGQLYDELFARLLAIDDEFSVNKDASAVSSINKAAGQGAVAVSSDVLSVLQTALYYADITGGAFDPTVGPLVKLWGINTDSAHVPSQAEIDAVLPLVNWRDVIVSTGAHTGNTAGTVMLRRKGMSLDLGGIVKGYAADELVKIMRAGNVKRAVIDLGGNIYVYGKKKDGSPWNVGIKDPSDPEGNPAVILNLAQSTVVTSGVYERYFMKDGIRYHHILDVRTGSPARTGLLSATIVSESSMAADALSTSVFVLGTERGLMLLRDIASGVYGELPHDGSSLSGRAAESVPTVHASVSGIFIADDGSITASEELRSSVGSAQQAVMYR